MSKSLLCATMFALLSMSGFSQGLEGGSILEAAPSPINGGSARSNTLAKTGTNGAKESKTGEKKPTEITSTKEASFDQKTRTAVFVGEVKVKDAQFDLNCDKLIAVLKDPNASQKAKPTPTAEAKGENGKNLFPTPGSGGLDHAIAEGNVVIVADRPGEHQGETTRYVARSKRAEFDAATGQMKLYGWPQIQQGINNQVATEESTVMIINRDGRMSTNGSSKTVIQDEPQQPPQH